MGLNHSPRVVTNGLVMCLDAENLKSYKGPPVQNILTHLTGSIINATGIVFNRGTEVVNIPEVGTVTSVTVTGYNDYPALSTACCPNLYSYYGASYLNVSPNTLYTYAILYKVDSGYTHPNFMYRYEYTSGNVYVTEAGVHSNTNRIHLGNGWYWAWGTFTTQATTAKISTFSFYYQTRTSANPDKMSVAKVLLVQGDYTKLHPKYWVDVNTTRANTSSMSDLVSSRTITANNLTYSNTGSFSFNGANNFINLGNTLADLTALTLDCWVYFNQQSSNYAGIISKTLDNTDGYELRTATYTLTTTNIQFRYKGDNAGTAVISCDNGKWLNIVATGANGSQILYINGVQVATAATQLTPSPNSNDLVIGKLSYSTLYMAGSIPVVKIYNRAISAEEVEQNFNATRGRFGV